MSRRDALRILFVFGTLVVFAVLPAAADAQYDHARVLDVEPIVERIRTTVPRERCWFETVRERRHARSTSAPLVGALVGGALGNAVGHRKRNKQVGAVVGAVLGGAIAHDISRHNARHAPARRVRREVCEVVEQARYHEHTTSYLVTYRYNGKTYRARMDELPGETIRVRVRVSPG